MPPPNRLDLLLVRHCILRMNYIHFVWLSHSGTCACDPTVAHSSPALIKIVTFLLGPWACPDPLHSDPKRHSQLWMFQRGEHDGIYERKNSDVLVQMANKAIVPFSFFCVNARFTWRHHAKCLSDSRAPPWGEDVYILVALPNFVLYWHILAILILYF